MSKEFKVGLFALISGVILYAGFNYLKGIEFFSNTNKYYALYDNVDGLNKSNPVIVNGFSVGRVSNIRILQNKGNKVLVELDVDENIIVSDSTLATLSNSDFLGSKAIVLNIGVPSNIKNNGDTLTAAIDKGLAAILESAQPITNNLAITIGKINKFLTDFEGVGDSLKVAMGSFTTGMNKFSFVMDQNKDSLKIAINNFTSMSSNLKSSMKKLDPILSKTDNALSKINNLKVEQTIADLNKLLGEMTKIMEGINAGTGSLGKIMKEDSLYNNMNKALIDLDKLLIHFNENPRHFMAPLGKKKKKIQKELEAGK